MPKEELVDVVVRELFEETCLTLTVDDLTMLSNSHVRVPLFVGMHLIVYGFATSHSVPYVIATNMRTPVKVSQAVTA
jgi:ADP-ribose pyrophosphatase YjhB (NUDIX family)